MIKVYIASPYAIGDKEENVRRQIDTAHILIEKGFAPYLPLLCHYQEQVHPRDPQQWLALDFEWIVSCDAMLRLPGESVGASAEVEFAMLEGLPIFYSIEQLVKYYEK